MLCVLLEKEHKTIFTRGTLKTLTYNHQKIHHNRMISKYSMLSEIVCLYINSRPRFTFLRNIAVIFQAIAIKLNKLMFAFINTHFVSKTTFSDIVLICLN